MILIATSEIPAEPADEDQCTKGAAITYDDFKQWSKERKESAVDTMSSVIIDQWVCECPNEVVVLQSPYENIPKTVTITKSDLGHEVIAACDIKAGEPVYDNYRQTIGADLIPLYQDNKGKYHFLHESLFQFTKSNTKWYFSYDTWINHSCEPNASHEWDPEQEDHYTIRAVKDITAGDHIRMDYLELDNSPDAIEPSYKVECMCGSTNCRGILEL